MRGKACGAWHTLRFVMGVVAVVPRLSAPSAAEARSPVTQAVPPATPRRAIFHSSHPQLTEETPPRSLAFSQPGASPTGPGLARALLEGGSESDRIAKLAGGEALFRVWPNRP